MLRADHGAHVRKTRKAYRILVGKAVGKNPSRWKEGYRLDIRYREGMKGVRQC
jgi:Ni/Co efflux regulator RcnB